MWLAMHANLRANAATTHMLTRFVRRMDKRTKQQLQHWIELSFGSIHFCGSLNPSIHQSLTQSINPSIHLIFANLWINNSCGLDFNTIFVDHFRA